MPSPGVKCFQVQDQFPDKPDQVHKLVEGLTKYNKLIDFTRRQKKCQFETVMAEMANDPAIRELCSVLSEEFTEAENDGL